MFKQLVDFELENLKSFIEEISQYIDSRKDEVEKNYKATLSEVEYNSEEESSFDGFFGDELYRYNKVFPKNYYNPLLTSIYGLLENWLKRLCDLDGNRGFSKVKVKDLAGSNYIEKSRKYLTIVAEIGLNDMDDVWGKIQQIQKVRNSIAHNDSNIRTDRKVGIDKQELYDFIRKDSRIELDENLGYFYIKDKDFLFEVMSLVQSYLNTVIDRLSSQRGVARNTTMPYDNMLWGTEKSERIIFDLICCVEMLEEFKETTDDRIKEDFEVNLIGLIGSTMWDATKLYSFFCDADWEVGDRDLLMREKRNGFEKLKEIYKR